jgi:hypothetical protein
MSNAPAARAALALGVRASQELLSGTMLSCGTFAYDTRMLRTVAGHLPGNVR